MGKDLGSFEMSCDAPPHFIVEACHKLKLSRPLDVRWHRIGKSSGEHRCSHCARTPPIKQYEFTFVSGRKQTFWFAQCQRCGTIHWDTKNEGSTTLPTDSPASPVNPQKAGKRYRIVAAVTISALAVGLSPINPWIGIACLLVLSLCLSCT